MTDEIAKPPKRRFAITRLDRVLAGFRSAFLLGSVIDQIRMIGTSPFANLGEMFVSAVVETLLLYAMVRGKRWAFGINTLEIYNVFRVAGWLIFWIRDGALFSFGGSTLYFYFVSTLYCGAFGLYSAARFFGALGPRRQSVAGILSEAPPWPAPLPPRLS